MIEYISFFKYLLITVSLEIIVGLLIFNKKKRTTTLSTILAMNLITNPGLNLFMKFRSILPIPINFYVGIVIGELTVLLLESLIIHKYLNVSKLRSFLSSLLLNLISLFLGQLFLNI